MQVNTFGRAMLNPAANGFYGTRALLRKNGKWELPKHLLRIPKQYARQMSYIDHFTHNLQLFALETMRDRYWHNMAIRIQRAWRNYMRYKHECARRIQRFWKNNKEAIVYAQVRDYGHQILAGRKERRRFSLLSYRRFFGDYLDVGGKNGSPLGETIREKCGLGCKRKFLFRSNGLLIHCVLATEEVSFSAQCQILVFKFGRSSTLSPRYIVVVSRK